jgi:hypothetical protein
MWDGYLSNPKRYTIPLGASIVASVGVLVIVMSVVYNLEVKGGGHWILALLPLISMFAFVALGLKRWHERTPVKHSANAQKHSKRTVHSDAQPNAQSAQPNAQILVIDRKEQAKQMKAEGFTIAQIADSFNVHRNTASAWVKETNGHHKETA